MKVCRTTWWMVVMLNMFKFSWLDRCANPSTSFQLVSSSTNLDKLHVSFHQMSSSSHLITPLVFPGGKRKAAYGWSCWKTLDQTLFPVPKVGTKLKQPDLRLFPFTGEWANNIPTKRKVWKIIIFNKSTFGMFNRILKIDQYLRGQVHLEGMSLKLTLHGDVLKRRFTA